MSDSLVDAFMAGAAYAEDRAEVNDDGTIDWSRGTEAAALAYAKEHVAAVDIEAARLAWERLEAACAGLLAQKCRLHRPYGGCPMDCGDVENALTPEFAEAQPLIRALLDAVETRRNALNGAAS